MDNTVSIYRRMVFYFLLIVIASFFMLGEFIYQTKKQEFKKIYTVKKETQTITNINNVNTAIKIMTRKIITMMILYFVFISIIIIMIIKDIILPIRYMIKIADKISEGDLSQTINLERNDDLARLGNVINELTSNLQELIAVTGNLNKALPEKVNNIKNCLYKLSDVKRKKDLLEIVKCVSNELKKISVSTQELKMIYDAFNLYTISNKGSGK